MDDGLTILILCILVIFGIGYWYGCKKSYDNCAKEIQKEKKKCEQTIYIHEKQYNELVKSYESAKKLYLDLQNISSRSFLSLTSAYSDFRLLIDNYSAKYLDNKKRPAHKEAIRIREVSQEKRQLILELKEIQYKYDFLIKTFPELTTYIQDFDSIGALANIQCLDEFKNSYDMTAQFISKEEYMKLDVDKRNQLALDRYVKGRRSNWQIGRDYELYCGYILRGRGYSVEQNGIEMKLNDLGRDIIAFSVLHKQTYVVQCKYWSQSKMIHENQIAQLFGTTIMYEMEHAYLSQNWYKVTPLFMTNINLSDTALEFAKRLGVEVQILGMGNYPRIKCNISSSGEKIYHLPFDQQYDSTKIDKAGEFYAMTVAEAVSKGFRRAYRHAYN